MKITIPTDWSPQERWVWKKLVKGEEADFNVEPEWGGLLFARHDEGWSDKRTITPKFLETILLTSPYKEAIHRNGVRIVGAWFKGGINLSNSKIEHLLYLDKCRFDKNVSFWDIKSASLISFSGSRFKGELDLHRADIASSLFLRDNALFDGEVNLASASIGGILTMKGSTFTDKVDMNMLKVTSNLFMGGKAQFEGEVNLLGASIGGQLAMVGSTFTGEVVMNMLKVTSSLFMSDKAQFEGEVNLVSASIGGALTMEGSTFKRKVVMERVTVGGNCIISGAEFTGLVDMSFAKIKSGVLNLADASFASLNLTGAKVDGVVCLGSKTQGATKWKKGATLTLRGAECGSLQDLEKSWPDKLDLDGFKYNRLDGFMPKDDDLFANRGEEWMKDWLNKNEGKIFYPQPYEQLAKVLRETGQKDKANEILLAGKQEERKNMRKYSLAWFSLFLQDATVGYGLRLRYTLGWALAFTFLGVFVLYVAGYVGMLVKDTSAKGTIARETIVRVKAAEKVVKGKVIGEAVVKETVVKETLVKEKPIEIIDIFIFSASKLLPILRIETVDIPLDPYSKGYFLIHSILGYVLAAFLASGLAGFMKKLT